MKANAFEAKSSVEELIARAEVLIPDTLLVDLQPHEFNPKVPEWHDFEYKIWEIGEEIRLLIVRFPSLRKQRDTLDKLVRIAVNRKSKRGRQTFIDLFGSKSCNCYSKDIGSQIDDPFVSGHVIIALRKMEASDYADQIRPFLQSEYAWIRTAAKRYLLKYDN
jgi:hypothetical protein